MQYLKKSFSSYANYNNEPKCYKCNLFVNVGIYNQTGFLCLNCYQDEKKKKEVTLQTQEKA